MRGRKPLPTSLKRLRGNPGGRPLNTREPRPAVTAGAFADAPPELADDPVAQEHWCRLVPVLRQAGQITDADYPALVATCLEWSRYLTAARQARHQATVKRGTGGLAASPHGHIAHRSLHSLIKLWAELGLTPSSRSRLTTTIPPAMPADPFAEFDESPRRQPS